MSMIATVFLMLLGWLVGNALLTLVHRLARPKIVLFTELSSDWQGWVTVSGEGEPPAGYGESFWISANGRYIEMTLLHVTREYESAMTAAELANPMPQTSTWTAYQRSAAQKLPGS